MHSVKDITEFGMEALTKMAEVGPAGLNVTPQDRTQLRKDLAQEQYSRSGPQFREVGSLGGSGIGALIGAIAGAKRGGVGTALGGGALGALAGHGVGRSLGTLGAKGYSTARGFTRRSEMLGQIADSLRERGISPGKGVLDYVGVGERNLPQPG